MGSLIELNVEPPGEPAEGIENAADALRFLLASGIAKDLDRVYWEPLSGGVSSDVIAVWGPDFSVVVKRALSKLKVSADWFAPTERIITEAKALQLAGSLIPQTVPNVLAFDQNRHILVIEKASNAYREWKTDLMAGVVDLDTARRLGADLAVWHSSTLDAKVQHDFLDQTAFEMLRVDPFYRWTAERNPSLSGAIGSVVDRMLGTRVCVVHGDFSPKNIWSEGLTPGCSIGKSRTLGIRYSTSLSW